MTNITLCLIHYSSDLVDALSAPIQFMSKEEKRARQMLEMGFDVVEIGEIPSSSSKKAAASSQESGGGAKARGGGGGEGGRGGPPAQRSNSTSAMQHVTITDKKKGNISIT